MRKNTFHLVNNGTMHLREHYASQIPCSQSVINKSILFDFFFSMISMILVFLSLHTEIQQCLDLPCYVVFILNGNSICQENS